MKKLIYVLFILPMFVGCHQGSMTEKLNGIDSLIVKEQYDSASVILKEMANASMTDEDQAHYGLLATKLGYLTSQPLESDSLLDLAIIYYNKVGNQQKLADAYYYKSSRLRINQDYPRAILYCKEAERLAMRTNDDCLQFKIVENLSYLNGLCENDLLQLQYAKKALEIAKKRKNNNWMAYSYNKISFAFANLGQYDSALVYVEKTIPYINYVDDSDKETFLTNIGLLYMDNDLQKAKEYFEKALSYGEHPGTLENLANVYYDEGNQEEAYKQWKKALTINGRYNKDNIIHNIMTYNLERGKLEEASKNLDEVIAIKDSMIYMLRNDTIKDLQLRFDHEVAMHEADKKLISTQRLILGLIILLGVMVIYIIIRKKKQEALEKEYQMQLYAYTTEINKLEIVRDNAQAQIKDLEGCKETDRQKICKLEEDVRNAEDAIEKLRNKIKEKLEELSPQLISGQILYEQIKKGEIKSIHEWSRSDEKLFVDYYNVMDYRTINRLTSVKRAGKLTTHNLFYLLLNEMGKTDSEIQELFGISHNALKVIKSKTKEID